VREELSVRVEDHPAGMVSEVHVPLTLQNALKERQVDQDSPLDKGEN
jgi:hypothetical protein